MLHRVKGLSCEAKYELLQQYHDSGGGDRGRWFRPARRRRKTETIPADRRQAGHLVDLQGLPRPPRRDHVQAVIGDGHEEMFAEVD